MATLKCHGGSIGQIEYMTVKRSYQANGKILENDGFGWKMLTRFVRPGVTPEKALETRRQLLADRLSENPAYAAFMKAFHKAVSFTKRWKVLATIQMMPDDPDGVWATMDDDGYKMDVSECVELCELYRTLEAEAAAKDSMVRDPA